jgi:hypothetical protein
MQMHLSAFEPELEPVRPDRTRPDETGFLPVHDIEIDTCISKFSAMKTTFIRFFLR